MRMGDIHAEVELQFGPTSTVKNRLAEPACGKQTSLVRLG
jgi:hypothetical protein